MNLKFVLPAALAAASLSFGLVSSVRAVGYTETGDAGDLLGTAQVIGTSGGTTGGAALTTLTGGLTLTNGISDSDLFEIYINSPSTFSASLTAFVAGSNNFDSQLALFTVNGQGVALDDDDPATGSPQSSLPAGNSLITSKPAGLYYLLISGSGRYAATAGNSLLFANFTDGTTDASVVQGPINAANVLGGYTGSSNEGGNYRITITGAQFVAAVPEPATYLYVAAGMVGLAFVTRARRAASSR